MMRRDAAPTLSHSRYVAGEVLGEGAQGVVLRVTDREAPERALVAKVWRAGRFPEAALRGEFALLARLSLPGVVRAHDFGVDERTSAPFLVEDCVAGLDAGKYLGQAEPEGRSSRVRFLLAGTLRALVGLHEAGFVHGDLKPQHVKVTAAGEVVLLDLGSAALAAARTTGIGTTGYMAPELAAGAAASVACDLYALGALVFKAITGEHAVAGTRALKLAAPWLAARERELVEALLALHPRDRPADAGDALSRLTHAADVEKTAFGVAAPMGRERELAELLAPATTRVRYLTGPSGIGKSHLARELWVRTLLSGRDARRLTLAQLDDATVGKLVTFFRGDAQAWPFGELPAGGLPCLLVLDALESAPGDLGDALEAFRCQSGSGGSLEVVAVRREAPPGAPALPLGPLDDGDFRELARRLGYGTPEQVALAVSVGRGNPGWLLSLRGGAPATREMVLERLQALDAGTREVVAAIALAGGELPETALRTLTPWPENLVPLSLSRALEAGLVVRGVDAQGMTYRLSSLELGAELVSALSSFEGVDRIAQLVLAEPNPPVRRLLAVASAPCPPERREELLARAAEAARTHGLRGDEIEALLALLARAEQRRPELLLRLERLLRDSGSPGAHPEVLAWLEQAAEAEPRLAPLVLRRQAERAARAGDAERAALLVSKAETRAAEAGDAVASGLVHASAGAIALYRADWPLAERELETARALLARADCSDAEELARLEHNAGVVDLYAERFEPAIGKLERALGMKRALGDSGGVRACLLNLGLALTRCGRFEQAEAALDEAIALARSLGQGPGEAWCLSARVDLEVRRSDVAAAERWLALAMTRRDVAPAQVQADLELFALEVALARGNAPRVLERLATVSVELLASDASIGSKALLVEAEARLASLPSQPRRAARLAARALRIALSARLGELERRARHVLATARPRSPARPATRPPIQPPSGSLGWSWLRELAAGLDGATACVALCSLYVKETAAERALLGVVERGELVFARGADGDGFELSNASARFDADFLRWLLDSSGAIHQRHVGSGSRIAAHAPLAGGRRVVVLVEHRYRIGHFDSVETERLDRWLTLAQLALRFVPSAEPNAPSTPARDDHDTTTREPALRPRRSFPEIVGRSPGLESALARLDAAIDSRLPVLVLGETGTGKELFARALHERGPRAGHPFVAVNCAAIADNLFEAELFGHVRGAFTGAERARPGLLAEAEGGTLLFDEIGELNPARQATLLRLLETGLYRPVGGDGERAADVRIVAATNRELEREVERGGFRRDLWFRLNVLEIRVPSLRERATDILLLVDFFLAQSGARARLSDAALAHLAGYAWPGNVRELEHVILRLASSGSMSIDVPDLPREIRRSTPRQPPALHVIDSEASSERAEVERALARAGGNITRAAQALGMTRHGLKKRMLRLGLRTRGAVHEG